jgi:hypothetical protein
MTGFLTRLAERSLSAESVSVRPRPVSLFEPVGGETDGDVVAVAPPPRSNGHRLPATDPVAAEPWPLSEREVPADARASPAASQSLAEARPSPPLEPPLERERATVPERARTESQPSVPEAALIPRERADAEKESAGMVFEPWTPVPPANEVAPAARPPRTHARIVPRAGDEHPVRANRGRAAEPAAAAPRFTERANAEPTADLSGHVSSPQRLALPDLTSVVAKRASGILSGGLRSPLVAAELPEPVVHVSIGRVEIRAQETPASRPTRERASRPPALGLSEYLQRRAREAAQ